MIKKPAHQVRPCENCPYRQDSPLKLWDRVEFETLLRHEQEPLGGLYACHKQSKLVAGERGLCAGWLLDQKNRGLPSIRLRLLLNRDKTAIDAYNNVNDGGHPMFKTVNATCRANGVRSNLVRENPPRSSVKPLKKKKT